MFRKIFNLLLLILSINLFMMLDNAFSYVLREDGKTYIIDRTGEMWNITQAVSLGFKAEMFQYGLGRNAFTTLDDSYLSDTAHNVPQNLRILGIAEGQQSNAYSIPKLVGHEISNSFIGSKPVAVGY